MPVRAQSETDTSAPTLAAAERVNDTTIGVTIADDNDIEESSISLSDFEISSGLLRTATVNESGSNATVNLTLANKLDTDNVTVSLDGTISDTAGNTVSSGSVTATGMDSRNPRLLDYRLERLNATHARVTVATAEQLSQLTLAVGGANTANLAIDDFSETVQSDGTARYTHVHEFDEEGETLFLLMELTDRAGNAVGYNVRKDYLADWTPPTAAIDGPHFVTAGDNHTFTSGAADNVAVASVQWAVDANTTRTGESINHSFATPGNRTLTATVTDGRNRTVTASHTVTVLPGASTDGVDVTPVSDRRTNVTVFANRTSQRVRITDDRGHLVSNDGVRIESLSVTPPPAEPLALVLSLDSRARAFTSATERQSVASFTVSHPSEHPADNVTVAFSVDRLRLLSVGLSPEEVSLYRLNGTWTERPTRVRFTTSERVHFVADSPGLSTFAIGASGTGDAANGETGNATGRNETNETDEQAATDSDGETADASDTTTPTPAPASLVVTDVRLAADTVSTAAYTVVTATVVNRGGQTGSRSITLAVNNTTVATRPVTVLPGGNRTVQFGVRVNESASLSVDGTPAGTVSVVDTATATAATRTATEATVSDTATTTSQATTSSAPAQTSETTVTTTGQQNGGGLPNPLALWPSGLVGTVLGAVIAFVTVSYGILKALAIYLGY